jgi:membrane-anchored mycosin MYCP
VTAPVTDHRPTAAPSPRRPGQPRTDRPFGICLGLAALVVAALTPPAAVPGAPRTAPAATVAGSAGQAASPPSPPEAVPELPAPPPVRVTPPAGRPPGRAAGLREPQRCTPPGADVVQAYNSEDSAQTRLQLAAAHRLATGRGQLVAVIDTGVAPHPLLGSRLRGGGDYLTGGDGLDDCDGHGTAVAGLLAAAPDPATRGSTPIGIAPQARLLAIRQSSPSYDVPAQDGGRRPAGDTETLAEAVVLAVRSGADVINVSEAVCLSPRRAASAGASLQAALRFAAEADVVVVAAAGNVGTGSCSDSTRGQVALPGWFGADVLTVGAVDPDGTPAPFTMPGPWVDVAAPGTDLRSLAVGGGTTGGLDGTSFATPWVAGLVALVRERFPELTASQVVDRILATARRTPDGGDAVGHGVIDPIAALTALPARVAPEPDPAAPTVAATLPGTTPAPESAPAADRPFDLLATAALLVAAGLAALVLRGHPRPDQLQDPRRRASRPAVGDHGRAVGRRLSDGRPPGQGTRCGRSSAQQDVDGLPGVGEVQRGPRR